MTQADGQWLGRGGQRVDSVRVGVVLVSLDGRRHPSCFLVPVNMQRQVLAVPRQDYGGGVQIQFSDVGVVPQTQFITSTQTGTQAQSSSWTVVILPQVPSAFW